jgi:vacuolar protein sorting-associated protein 13A/C
LIFDNLRASSEDLTARIMLHYRQQLMYQIHRVLGSIDILGNPIGLFHTLSSGVGELFYEPYQGFIMSDRPQDLGIGIAKVRDWFLYIWHLLKERMRNRE